MSRGQCQQLIGVQKYWVPTGVVSMSTLMYNLVYEFDSSFYSTVMFFTTFPRPVRWATYYF